jgi:hypothetical protein
MNTESTKEHGGTRSKSPEKAVPPSPPLFRAKSSKQIL